jgi:hypothetical protein
MNALRSMLDARTRSLGPIRCGFFCGPFTPGDVQRLERIGTAIMSISASGVGPLIEAITLKFSESRQQISNPFKERLKQLRQLVSIDQEISEQR